MATLKLYLDTRSARADGTYSIRLAINHHGGTAFISLNQYARRDEWDKATGRVKKRPDKDAINDFLLDRLSFYNKMMMQAQCRETYRGDISARELRDLIMLEAEPPKEQKHLLKEVFDSYTAREMKPNTKTNYLSTWRLLHDYCKDIDTLPLDNINRDWLERFNTYMIGRGHKHNTRTTHLRHISALFNYAIDCELTKNYPFRRLNISMEETRNRDLKVDELRAVFNAEIPFKQKKFVDAFKLMFFLIGINNHDFFDLKPENVKDGRLEYKRLKTGKRYSIKLEPEAIQIIKKYQGDKKLLSFCEEKKDYRSFGDSLNHYIGMVHEGLTSYYARHTWATLAFKLGIPKDTISMALGHSFGIRVTDTYINADLSAVDEANRKVIDFVLYDKK